MRRSVWNGRASRAALNAVGEDLGTKVWIGGFMGIVFLVLAFIVGYIVLDVYRGAVDRGQRDAVLVVRDYSPGLAERLFDVPAVELTLEETKWCLSDAAESARTMSSGDLEWCASAAGEAVRELGPDVASWAGSDVGRRAHELVDGSTVQFLASSWGRTAQWAWAQNREELGHLERMVRCEHTYLERDTSDDADYEVCRFTGGFTGWWWVPPRASSAAQ